MCLKVVFSYRDTDSCINIIVAEAIKRLGLVIKLQRNPYVISWINDKKLRVTVRFLVKFLV